MKRTPNTKALQATYGFENPFIADPLVRRAIRYCRGKKVLDVGCGEGADSSYFARKGFSVTAFDQNETQLERLVAYRKDHGLTKMTVLSRNALEYGYPRNTYDVVSCILVGCCMKRSECERLIGPIKRSVKPGGIVIMSARNYLDPELNDYCSTGRMLEPNTFKSKEDCCHFMYFIEKNRLRELFDGFEILYYYEGFAPCKYNQHPKHGDSYIICRRSRRR